MGKNKKKKKRKRDLRKDTLTLHHINPSSRGGSDKDENIALVPDKRHKAYHIMFSNMTPDEIIHCLVGSYWEGQWGWVAKAIVEKELDEENLP